MNLLKEFRPALLFLGKFLVLYLLGNVLYAAYVESFESTPDPITRQVTAHTSSALNRFGYETSHDDVPGASKVALKEGGVTVLNVFEGCNGVNVMIVFVSFLFAFGGPLKFLSFFLPAGLIVIHLANLLRIGLLFYLSQHNSDQFYYYHKYFFTATLYAVVFALWALWVMRFNEKRVTDAASA